MTHLLNIKHVLHQAGSIAMDHYTKLTANSIYDKSRYERVTTVDFAIDKLLRKTLPGIFPAPVLSEESKKKWKPVSTFWVIDPLDGTTNYYTCIPFFCIGIGLVINNAIAINAVYNPVMHELFIAERGKGAYLNEKRLHRDKKLRLEKSIIGMSYSHAHTSIKKAGAIGLKLRETVHNTRHAGSSLLTMAYVAAGRLEAEIIVGPVTLWDTIPGLLLIEEVKGIITDFSGNPYDMLHTKNIIASNATEHSRIVDIVKRLK